MSIDHDHEHDHDYQTTLARLAAVAAPEGLAERVNSRVKSRLADEAAQQQPSRSTTYISWRTLQTRWASNMPARLRIGFALAVLLLAALIAGGWHVYQARHAQAAHALPLGPVPTAPATNPHASGFSTAGAVRVPPTLKPLHVPPPPSRAK